MSTSKDFPSYLSSRLPTSIKLRIYHVSTAPTSCPPLYAPAPGQGEEQTKCESHFLAISQPEKSTSITSNNHDSQIIVLGIEVLVFTSSNLTTIFVSKADSTGFLSRQPNLPRGISLAQLVITSFLDFLISHKLSGPRLVLSLFARSQNQYLFPGSIENASKHVLDDRQLIKWWCRVLDPIVHRQFEKQSARLSVTQAHIVVPGCDKSETRVFFPASARLQVGSEARWIARYPVELLVKDKSLPPRCLVPRLPDDPKARFLDDLDGNQVNHEGKWSGVRSLDQFWELMSYRQECSAGRLVGFIWVTFPYEAPCQKIEGNSTHADTTNEQSPFAQVQHIIKSDVQDDLSSPPEEPQKEDVAISMLTELAEDKSGAESENLPHQLSDEIDDTSKQNDILPTADNTESSSQDDQTTQGQIALTQSNYLTLMDHLLDLDFAGSTLATQSTTDWISKTKSLANQTNFGIEIEGTMEIPIVEDIKNPNTNTNNNLVIPSTQITNILTTAVRKKRKADSNPDPDPEPAVVVGGGGGGGDSSVPDVIPSSTFTTTNGEVVNTLNRGLIRKKPKS